MRPEHDLRPDCHVPGDADQRVYARIVTNGNIVAYCAASVDGYMPANANVRGHVHACTYDGARPYFDIEPHGRIRMYEYRSWTIAEESGERCFDGWICDAQNIVQSRIRRSKPGGIPEYSESSPADKVSILLRWGVVNVSQYIPRRGCGVDCVHNVVYFTPLAATAHDDKRSGFRRQ